MKREIADFIQAILEAIDDIEAFTQGLDFETFKQDRKTIYAVARAIEIMSRDFCLYPSAPNNDSGLYCGPA